MANEKSAEAQEIEFRRRWYEAHLRQVEPDYAEASEWVSKYYAGADEAFAIRDRLAAHGDLERFKAELQTWSVKPDTEGFNGPAGMMLVNSLVNRTDDPAELARLLTDGLTAPRDRASAAQKLDALIGHIDRIKVGAHPAPGHAPFLLSYFWGLDRSTRWPVVWPSGARFLEFITGQPLPKPSGERYLQYADQAGALDDDPDRFQVVANWWDSSRPVFLDPVLVERCAFGMQVVTGPSEDYELARENGHALAGISKYIYRQLADDISDAVGFPLGRGQQIGPTWGKGSTTPRPTIYADWPVKGQNAVIRLDVNHRGAFIGIYPVWREKGWYKKAEEIFIALELDGFHVLPLDNAPLGGGEKGLVGARGGVVYGRWYEPDQLAGLDLCAEVKKVSADAGPVFDALIESATNGTEPDTPPPSVDDPLAPVVERFRRSFGDTGYPTDADELNRAAQLTFRRMLLPENLPAVERSELKKLWAGQTHGYGNPGVQSALHASVNNADEGEYQRILDTIEYLCWGEGDDADRIDAVLDAPDKINGLGESVVMKLLAICHPDRYLCVYPYWGDYGKLQLLRVLGLEEPSREASAGQRNVESNNRLWERIEPFFPGDPWGMMQFLYWYDERGEEAGSEVEDGDPIGEAAEDLLVDRSFLEDIVGLLEDKGQVILYGPPGTGKTFLARRLAEALAPDPAYRKLVQFHPSTSYEDFFEGYRPEQTAGGGIGYRLTQGPLARMAEHALEHPDRRHVMVIDEINRANLPRVLGELLFLFEYRDEQASTLYRPDDEFWLPDTVWFIGTMNTADRSIALVDAALRRRFHFVPFFPRRGPTAGLLERWLEREGQPVWVGELVAMVNDELTEALGGDLQLGASHFMRKGYRGDPGADDVVLRRIWEYNIEPFVEDQFFGDAGQIENFRFEVVVARYRRLTGEDDPQGDVIKLSDDGSGEVPS